MAHIYRKLPDFIVHKNSVVQYVEEAKTKELEDAIIEFNHFFPCGHDFVFFRITSSDQYAMTCAICSKVLLYTNEPPWVKGI